MTDKQNNENHSEDINKTNEEKKDEKSVSLIALVITALLVALISIAGTYTLLDRQYANETTTTAESESTNEAESNNQVPNVFTTAFDLLKTGSIYDTEDNALIEGAINGMADAFDDPYTDYLDKTEVNALNDQIEGSFEGIGAEVTKYGEYVKIISAIPGSPAEKAGLMANDLISMVDDESVADLSINEAVNLIRGEEGTDVTLTITRGDVEMEVTITRGTIPVETVYAEVDETDATIGHITISNFAAETSVDLIDAIEDLSSKGVEKYIFDLRGNPGGLLTSGLETANIFVPKGENIMSVEDANGEVETYKAGDQFGLYKFDENAKAVVLVNNGSASAAEILASSLKATGIPLIGETTFGKGTVQSVVPMDTGGELKYTSAKWLTGAGDWINEAGIAPNKEVSLPDYANLFYINPEESYEEGQNSDAIANINSILIALGYDAPDSPTFDEKTTAAVQAFQREQGIEVDGIVSDKTSAALIQALQRLIANNDTQYEAAIDYLQGNLEIKEDNNKSENDSETNTSQAGE